MSRRKRKERQFKKDIKENNHLQVITGGQLETIHRSKEVRIVPRNFKQDDLLELLQDDTKHIVFATGQLVQVKRLLAPYMLFSNLKKVPLTKLL